MTYFNEYKKRNVNDLELVLIGGGSIDIPEDVKLYVHDLGFVDVQDKYDAYAGALCLCQPSTHESFSYVIMESWLCERPVLVHEDCDVTKNFAIESQGGLYFKSFFDFEGCINYYIRNEDISHLMGKNGRKYVIDRFGWDKVVSKYMDLFRKCM